MVTPTAMRASLMMARHGTGRDRADWAHPNRARYRDLTTARRGRGVIDRTTALRRDGDESVMCECSCGRRRDSRMSDRPSGLSRYHRDVEPEW